ncbi:MAG: RimK family alpha-L-glutamate ligase [Candidatus Gracilibacteria bacterium]|jgi:ribosomal protein S6--L-glutamate ligase|nr:RimK family alpha-L-glutamate ligase [Candidatus Gracilibacteria bacterium]
MVLGIFYYSKSERENENFATSRLYFEAKKRDIEVKYYNFLKFRIKKSGEIFYCGERFKVPDCVIIRSVFDFESRKIKKIFSYLEKSKKTKILNNFEAKKNAKNKISTYNILKKNQIDTPKTVVFRKNLNPQKLGKNLDGFPIILKDANLMKGLGMRLIKDQAELISVLKRKKRSPHIFQEFIKEANGSYMRVFVIKGQVIAHKEISSNNSDIKKFSETGEGKEIFSLSKEEKNLAILATNSLCLDYSGVDIIRSDRGPLVLEVNSNPGFKNLEKSTGKNIAGKIIESTF